MEDKLLKKEIAETIDFFDHHDLTDARSIITQIKKSKALSNLGLAIAITIIGPILFIYGCADVFGNAILPYGIISLIGGIVMILLGIALILSSSSRALRASEFFFANDIEKLCEKYYKNVFCSKTTDMTSKDDQIIDVCQYIVPHVLQKYKKKRWQYLLNEKKKGQFSTSVECSICQRKSDIANSFYGSIPNSQILNRKPLPEETKNLINNLYFKCEICGSVFCYTCLLSNSIPAHKQYICPECGNARKGWDGLSDRWNNLRQKLVKEDTNFTISSINIETYPGYDKHFTDLKIHIKGSPFNSITFYNIAYNLENKMFLLTPEPIVE